MGAPQRFSRETACAMKADGYHLATIAERCGVSITMISRVTKGIKPDATRSTFVGEVQRHGPVGLLPAQIRAINDRLTLNWHIGRICRDLSVSRAQLHKAHTAGRIDLTRAGDPPRGLSSSAARVAFAPVPDWVAKADLSADYRDFTADFGPEIAARECRRLKAEAAACR